MARDISLNFRTAIEADATGEVPVVLIRITHPDSDAPILLSTDPTERLGYEPLVYGTRSQGHEWQFMPISARLPDETDDVLSTQLIIENVGGGLVAALATSTEPGRVDLQVVLASSPNLIEEEYRGLLALGAEADIGQIEITLARESDDAEPWPCDRMTAGQFPGLFR